MSPKRTTQVALSSEDNKTNISFYFCEKPASLRQNYFQETPPTQHKKIWFHPHNQQKNKKFCLI
jgi:hypothetical protein